MASTFFFNSEGTFFHRLEGRIFCSAEGSSFSELEGSFFCRYAPEARLVGNRVSIDSGRVEISYLERKLRPRKDWYCTRRGREPMDRSMNTSILPHEEFLN